MRRPARTGSFSSAASSAENDSMTSHVSHKRTSIRRDTAESGTLAAESNGGGQAMVGGAMMRHRMPQLPVENTYRMDPIAQFPVADVRRIVAEIVRIHVAADYNYNSKQVGHHLKLLTSEIKAKVKAMDLPRFKIVCHTLLMSRCSQSGQSSSRCLWDSGRDSHATVTVETSRFILTASVFGIYQE